MKCHNIYSYVKATFFSRLKKNQENLVHIWICGLQFFIKWEGFPDNWVLFIFN